METFKKNDHVLENPRQCAGESEKLGDWEVSSQRRAIERSFSSVYI